MAVRATKLLLAVFVVFLLGAAPAGASALAQPPTTTTAPAGPVIDAPSEADTAKTRNNLIIGAVAVVLLGIVIYGNRKRAKKK
ncbi:hypothetical protein UO65_4024 [Actinokineospora spheciospongiae]|uniref:Gram-positive cocci surface proteins LPxTG domain-containing protein n=1 Tax=Actinokineospora spheciospongiae TaxID=909613 RepID=W7IW98_9PSEU|nr:hypothetical protein [Actinokineospora spheciospongiae]EWC60741.1 hypothetical protein UO65_4024 [Actinokineospora spheciospongiae]PWW64498.1 hypothetical protein DFQ13_103472 [Actinokineospora spheciospongiae]